MKLKKTILLFSFATFLFNVVVGQSSTFVDDDGIMRWTETNKEVCAFGTNYSVPFSYWKWREPIGADQMKAIDEDVYHIARLGLDGYRIHVWDVFISDSLGNLVYNKHFHLYDYLQFKLKERGIKMYVTPMNLFTDVEGGFASHFNGKVGCLSDSSVFPVMENYLKQFFNHVNPYTGIAYKDDPDIMAIEIVNEPAHFKRPDLVTEYINRMYDAIRSTGCQKPIMYNMTTCAPFIDRVLPSKVEGGSFQWYPSGLTCNHDLKGNMLPNVDKYYIPFADKLKETKRPKFVYEFCPSDIGASGSVYPAMARSFREAGFQFAAHFAYDPLHAAYCNIEYRTHFLNLAYTPQKAIGMMIASEAFHAIPLNKSYGRYPKNNRFESFRLSAEKDLAEMVTKNKFLYSNSTETRPPNPEKLIKIAGTGNSSVVKYSGTGVYFLDKLEDGVWRLEVMPDAFWVSDPFFVPYSDRETAVTVCRTQKMQISLPGLSDDFSVKGLNEGNETNMLVTGGLFKIDPGAYLLVKKGRSTRFNAESKWQNIRLKEFHIPDRKLEKTYVLHTPPREVNAGEMLTLNATVVSPQQAAEVDLVILKQGGGETLKMTPLNSYDYMVQVPVSFTETEQVLRYYIQIKRDSKYLLFPGEEEGSKLLERRIYEGDQRIDDAMPYEIKVVSSQHPIVLFDAENDWQFITKMRRKDKLIRIPAEVPGKSLLCFSVNNLNNPEHDNTWDFWCGDKVKARYSALENKRELLVYGKALNSKACKMQISLLLKDGSAFGGIVELNEAKTYIIQLNKLKNVKSVLMPRPYPSFHAFWFEPSVKSSFNINEVEKIQFSIGPDIAEDEYGEKHGVAVGWVTLK